jgi:hypothetical protein
MANTIRQTISLIRPQLEVVREEATRLGVTPAELIRRVLDIGGSRRQPRRGRHEGKANLLAGPEPPEAGRFPAAGPMSYGDALARPVTERGLHG